MANENLRELEPIEDRNDKCAPNVSINCFDETIEPAGSTNSKEATHTPEAGDPRHAENAVVANEPPTATPSNEELREAAKRFPPPPEWFDEDEERPF